MTHEEIKQALFDRLRELDIDEDVFVGIAVATESRGSASFQGRDAIGMVANNLPVLNVFHAVAALLGLVKR